MISEKQILIAIKDIILDPNNYIANYILPPENIRIERIKECRYSYRREDKLDICGASVIIGAENSISFRDMDNIFGKYIIPAAKELGYRHHSDNVKSHTDAMKIMDRAIELASH